MSTTLTSKEIPVIDFGAYSVEKDVVCREKLNELVDDIYLALHTTGFIYLKNHGIDTEKVNRVFEVAEKFFSMPDEIKVKYSFHNNTEYHGYMTAGYDNPGIGNECSSVKRKENFTYREKLEEKKMPDKELPEFRRILADFYKICAKLSWRLMEVLAIVVKLPDSKYFSKAHSGLIGGKNTSGLVCHQYPPIPEDYEVKEGQLRCGQHTDITSLTLLFQDNTGGLQHLDNSGRFVAATPIEGTVVVHIGDFMQRWTADDLKATIHRVVIPPTDGGRSKGRQAIAFFANPDDGVVVECLDGSNKYPPINATDVITKNLYAVYNNK
ncbi:uncharacterized protein LOC144446876 [Glandiceps talaboti]